MIGKGWNIGAVSLECYFRGRIIDVICKISSSYDKTYYKTEIERF